MAWTVMFEMTDQKTMVGTVTATCNAGAADEFVFRTSVNNLESADVDKVVQSALDAQKQANAERQRSDEIETKITGLFQAAFDKVAP